MTLRFPAAPVDAEAEFRLGALAVQSRVKKGATQVVFERLTLPAGPGRLEGRLNMVQRVVGVHYIEVGRL